MCRSSRRWAATAPPGSGTCASSTPTASSTAGLLFDRDTVEGWVRLRARPFGPVPVLDVIHPRFRTLAADPRQPERLRTVRPVESTVHPRPALPAEPGRDPAVLHRRGAAGDVAVAVAVAGGRLLHADALVRDPDRRNPRPADQPGRPPRRPSRHRELQRRPQPPAADHRPGQRRCWPPATTRRHDSCPGRRTFFVSGTGGHVSPAAVGVMFNRIWDQAGCHDRPVGSSHVPTIFAIISPTPTSNDGRSKVLTSPRCCPTCPATWATPGIESTYYYIHTSPDFLHAYADLTGRAATVLPEVGFDETRPGHRHPGLLPPRPGLSARPT